MSIARRIGGVALACAVLAVVTSGALLWAHGYRVYVVHTGSMSPTYRPGDVVVDRPPQPNYRAGQVITFRHSPVATDVVTHRITDVTAAGLIHTKGDANRTADAWDIRPGQVRGSVVFGARKLGYLLVFLRQPAGTASLACALLAVLLLWRCFFPAAIDPAGMSPRRQPAHRSR
jgi:signal peptidase